MGRYRSPSRSYSPRRSHSPRRSPSPPSRRKRYDDPRDRYRGGRGLGDRRSAPSGLLVRNIPLDARPVLLLLLLLSISRVRVSYSLRFDRSVVYDSGPDDLRIPFERFGPVKDVYLPKNYYTGEPRGFGFVKFRYAEDAAEAKQQMNHQLIGGREITTVYAEENRKTPQEMRTSERVSGRYVGGSSRRRSPPRSPRRRYRSYSRSPSPRHYSRDRDRNGRYDSYSPRRSISPSRSPPSRGKRYSGSPRRSFSPSPRENDRSPSRSRSYSR
ncbi:hypothetical protein AAC387_Pa09g0436 [Persea americana]